MADQPAPNVDETEPEATQDLTMGNASPPAPPPTAQQPSGQASGFFANHQDIISQLEIDSGRSDDDDSALGSEITSLVALGYCSVNTIVRID